MKKLVCIVLLLCIKQANAQIISTIAGNGTGAYAGDNGQANVAELNAPSGVFIDMFFNMYIADAANNIIRKVDYNTGVITSFAGTGTAGYSGDHGFPGGAMLNHPSAVTSDFAGNVYIADANNNTVRKVDNTNTITSIAGHGGGSGYGGDGGLGINAHLNHPSGVASDGNNVYIADMLNNVIRKVNNSGTITTIAGTGGGYSGDGGPATAAQLSNPIGLAIDGAGNLYIADFFNNRIRVINTLGIINTIAGNGTAGFAGDGGQATAAELNQPAGVAIDGAGNLYITDANNAVIRQVNSSGIISTIAGNGTVGYSGDGGQATAAELNILFGGILGVGGISCDMGGDVFIADGGNNRIRMISRPLPISVNTATVCAGTTTTLTASGATTYTWMPGGATTTSITPSPTVTTTYTVSGSTSYTVYNNPALSLGYATPIVTVNALPTVTVNSATVCPGNTTTLTASGANTYTWNTSVTGATITPSPTVTTIYTVTGTDANSCTNTATGIVTAPANPAPDICMVSTDSFFVNNIVYWDRTQYPNADSFMVYRLSAGVYLQIGATSKDSNQLTDIKRNIGGPNGGDPNLSSWFYKIAVKDTCGNISLMSPYHETVNFQQNNQNLSWNAYVIESPQINPVNNYEVWRDSLGIGDWHIFANTSALSSNDASYASYPNAVYRVDATPFTCTSNEARLPVNNNTFAARVRSHSNTYNNRTHTTSIKQLAGSNVISVYPNPNNGSFVIESNNNTKQTVQMYDVNGKLVLSQTINGKATIDASSLNEGIYNISLISNEGVVNKRLVIVR